MNRSRSTSTILLSGLVAIAVAVLLVLVARGALGREDRAGPSPSQPPSTPPRPTTAPSAPTRPTLDFESGVRIPLRTATGETLGVYVKDSTGSVVNAVSGVPREDVSVGPRRVVVTQIDARTIGLTWADTAINEDVFLSVSRAGGTFRIEVIRRHLSPDIEIAHERVLVLTFDSGVNAAGIAAKIKNSLDTDD